MSADPVIDVRVLASDSSSETAFDHNIMSGVAWTPLSAAESADTRRIADLVARQQPDVVVVAGWLNPAFNALPRQLALQRTRFVMGMDTPWRGDLRQLSASIALRHYLRDIDAVVVSGERSWQYAVRLGFPAYRIFRGLYGVDYAALAPLYDTRAAASWPRSFLFAGRYHSEKGVDLMIEAYRAYRAAVVDPWPLVCCGKGDLGPALAVIDGIRDLGFVQPVEVRTILRETGAFLLPSRYDPWPLALVEACAAGLPVVASDACGSAVECLRGAVSGHMIATGDARALTVALIDVHHNHSRLPAMGAVARTLAAPYSTDAWLEKWRAILTTTRARPRRRRS